MSFSEEVEALRRRAGEARSARAEAQAAFEIEVRELWQSAEQYWRSHPANQVDIGLAEWVAKGGKVRFGSGETAPLPFPSVQVFVLPRERAEWEAGAVIPTERADGLDIGGWFALCAPGEVREILPRYTTRDNGANSFLAGLLGGGGEEIQEVRANLVRRYHGSYFRTSSTDSPPVMGEDPSSYCATFAGPRGKPDVVLRCDASNPIDIFVSSPEGWQRRGTLREQVVEAMERLTRRVDGEGAPGSSPSLRR